ncbi:hypothetical protein EJ05DRAFT_506143 [Pseudovirgaria hyperparasitica]|uniref:LysR family regulatory protein n=1 Tax=Pseudovirgaria hyperparasitica TaxID=470096 RepID=A0A6A6WK53_9PEZI|nr:uncharacterized protein EJ05DRAFT_506143 [Pseudovirgaria hyperparasitica]KAF2762411.1 hypothetical protein EJ05DRAFT_506143 [Pseudovirgaria hyperparasitica]
MKTLKTEHSVNIIKLCETFRMWPFWSKKPTAPATVPTDKIIPLHKMDDTPIFRSMAFYSTMRFDAVLDPEKLRGALETLLETGDWRKLGARLRLNDTTKKLEYHIPASFSAERPAFIYVRERFECRIEEHALASQLPKASIRPTVMADTDSFEPLVRLRKDAPTRLEDWLYTDEPQLTLAIVSFEDATLVTVSWPHTLIDAAGLAYLLKAWSDILSGHVERVPAIAGFDTDPLETLGSKPIEEHVMSKWRVKGFQIFLFIINYILDIIWYPKESGRAICIPPSVFQRIKEECATYISAAHSMHNVKLTDGDVLSALIARLMCVNLPHNNRTLSIVNVVELRRPLAEDLLLPGKAYISNAVIGAVALTTVKDVFTQALGATALKVRNAIRTQRTRAQVETFMFFVQEAKGMPVLFGDGNMKMVNVTNWTGAKFYETDFSAAIVGNNVGPRSGDTVSGKPSYINVSGISNDFKRRGSAAVVGRDVLGNYWIIPWIKNNEWKKVEEYISSLE